MKHSGTRRYSLIMAVAVVMALAGILQPAGHASAASSLKLSRNQAAPGDSITISGYGFQAQDDIVATIDAVVSGKLAHLQTSSHTDDSGSFSASLTLPKSTSQGTADVTGRDFHGHSASTPLTVVPLAYLQAGGQTYTTYVIPTHLLYVSGAGYLPNESLKLSATFPLYDGNSALVNRTIGADSKGSFYEVAIRIPLNAKIGTVLLQATGSKKTGKARLAVIYRPFITTSAGTVRPGTAVRITGHEFVPKTTITVSVRIPRNGTTTETLSKQVLSDDRGAFTTTIDLPSNVKIGKYSVGAYGGTGHNRAFATVQVSVHPSILLKPATAFPGEAIAVSGENFGSGAQISVSGGFATSAGIKTVSVTTQAGGRGNYSTRLVVPGNAYPGKVNITARSSNGGTSASLQVNPRPQAKATPTPTLAATSAPAPTGTVPPTSTPTPKKKKGFGYRYVSIWYHTVRVGTYDHLVVQGSLHTVQGLWVHVYFPSGAVASFYENTDSSGHWEKTVNVPGNAIAASNNKVVVTFRLWHGAKSRRFFSGFSLTR